MEKVIELKSKYEQLQQLADNRGSEFIGTISDFNILRAIEELSDEELLESYSPEDITHCINSIDSYINGETKNPKLDFSLKTIIQINDLINGKIENNQELLQALYMSIFARYNDDIKTNENYHVTPEFANLVFIFDGEELPEKIKDIKSSETDIGNIFMTEKEYMRLVDIWQKEFPSDADKKAAFKTELVTYVLSNIRNRMMHGDYENTTDKEGNSIVKISPRNFKSKFFFGCILEFYEAISEEIRNRVGTEDSLFDLEKILLNKAESNMELLNDKDKLMSAILPIYINSFITYNFNDSKKDIKKLRGAVGDSDAKKEFLDLYYKSKSEESFAYKIADYNKNNFNIEYTAYDIINHLRNSIVHNNYKCDNGIIYIKDFDESGSETARFLIPYELVEELISKQSEQAKLALGYTLPGNPNSNGHKEHEHEI